MQLKLIKNHKGLRKGKVYMQMHTPFTATPQVHSLIDHQQKVIEVPKSSCILYLPDNDYPLSLWSPESRDLLVDTIKAGYLVERWTTEGLCGWEPVTSLPLYGHWIYRSLGEKTAKEHTVSQKHIQQRIKELENELKQLKDKLDAPTEDTI